MISTRTFRTAMLLGEEAIHTLRQSKVIVFGAGGVGGYAIEGLARAGVGTIAVVDPDRIAESNLNRQILATVQTVGTLKTEAAKARILSVNPDAAVECYPLFYMPDTADTVDLKRYDYIIDAIDTVTAKIELAVRATEAGIPILSCMGTGNKTDPSRLKIADLSKTSVCPLARVMRRELHLRGIRHLSVVYSDESPLTPANRRRENGRDVPGSLVTVPAVAGMLIASRVISDLIEAAPCRHREEVGRE